MFVYRKSIYRVYLHLGQLILDKILTKKFQCNLNSGQIFGNQKIGMLEQFFNFQFCHFLSKIYQFDFYVTYTSLCSCIHI